MKYYVLRTRKTDNYQEQNGPFRALKDAEAFAVNSAAHPDYRQIEIVKR